MRGHLAFDLDACQCGLRKNDSEWAPHGLCPEADTSGAKRYS